MGRPECAVGRQPVVERFQGPGADPVEAALGIGPDIDQPGISEHPEMLRHRRLAQVEMVDQLADRPLTVTEEIEDGPAARFGQDVQCGKGAHLTYITRELYTGQAVERRISDLHPAADSATYRSDQIADS